MRCVQASAAGARQAWQRPGICDAVKQFAVLDTHASCKDVCAPPMLGNPCRCTPTRQSGVAACCGWGPITPSRTAAAAAHQTCARARRVLPACGSGEGHDEQGGLQDSGSAPCQQGSSPVGGCRALHTGRQGAAAAGWHAPVESAWEWACMHRCCGQPCLLSSIPAEQAWPPQLPPWAGPGGAPIAPGSCRAGIQPGAVHRRRPRRLLPLCPAAPWQRRRRRGSSSSSSSSCAGYRWPCSRALRVWQQPGVCEGGVPRWRAVLAVGHAAADA